MQVNPETGEVEEKDDPFRDPEMDTAMAAYAMAEGVYREARDLVERLALEKKIQDYSFGGFRVRQQEQWQSTLPKGDLARLGGEGHPAIRHKFDLDLVRVNDMMKAGGEIAARLAQELALEQVSKLGVQRETRKGR